MAILIFDYFARRHPEALVDDSGGRFGTGRNYGVGGEFDTSASAWPRCKSAA